MRSRRRTRPPRWTWAASGTMSCSPGRVLQRFEGEEFVDDGDRGLQGGEVRRGELVKPGGQGNAGLPPGAVQFGEAGVGEADQAGAGVGRVGRAADPTLLFK